MLSSSDCLSDTEHTKDDNQASHFVDKYIAVKLTDEHEYSHANHCLTKAKLGERFFVFQTRNEFEANIPSSGLDQKDF